MRPARAFKTSDTRAYVSAFLAITLAMGCGINVVGGFGSDDEPASGPNETPQSSGGSNDGDGSAADSSNSSSGSSGTSGGSSGASSSSGDANTPNDASNDVAVTPKDSGGPPPPCAACPAGTAQRLCISNQCVDTRRVFVSSTASTANLGGISGADSKCQSLATAATLGGTWRAWVSSNASSVASRFSKATVPYRLLSGTAVANNWTDLTDGSLLHGIDRDEKNAVAAATEVWTATSTNGGFTSGGCDSFTSGANNSPTVAQGITDQTNNNWTNIYVQFCDRTNPRIYCFEQ